MNDETRLPSELAELEGAEQRTENAGRVAGMVQRIRVVFDYVNGTPRRIAEERAATTDHGVIVLNYFARAMAMARSLGRLDEPSDYQLVMAGVRSLFEMVVDMTLINAGSHSLEKLWLWEDSARLEAAQTMERHQAKKPAYKMPEAIPNWLKNVEAVQARRERHWRKPPSPQQPKLSKAGETCTRCKDEDERRIKRAAEKAAEPTAHPDRWTGPGRTLFHDAEEADKQPGAGDLVDFYFTMNKVLCWGTHGSGAVGLRQTNIGGFPAWHWVPMSFAVRLVLRVTQLCLVHFDGFDEYAEKVAIARGWDLYQAAYTHRLQLGPDRAP